MNGRGGEALEAGSQAIVLARHIGDPLLLGAVLYQFGTALAQIGDARAESVLLEALQLVEQSGDVLIANKLHNNYAIVLIARGDLAGARRHLEADARTQWS